MPNATTPPRRHAAAPRLRLHHDHELRRILGGRARRPDPARRRVVEREGARLLEAGGGVARAEAAPDVHAARQPEARRLARAVLEGAPVGESDDCHAHGCRAHTHARAHAAIPGSG
eukprot:5500451-Prymnesium_polylepis.1